jgi:hypothetical protein
LNFTEPISTNNMLHSTSPINFLVNQYIPEDVTYYVALLSKILIFLILSNIVEVYLLLEHILLPEKVNIL